MPTQDRHTVTLRLPAPLYRNVKRLARERHVSVNRLAEEELKRLTDSVYAEQMRAAYDELGADGNNDAESFFAAQHEIISADD